MVRYIIFATGLVLGLSPETKAQNSDWGRVEVVRDEWGIPHIFAETDAGALYGLGYATAQDRGFQMHYQLRMIQGRSAEVLGDVAKIRPRGETALTHDKRMRTFGLYHSARNAATRLDEATLKLLEAYSQGVNDFFAEGRLHRLYAEVGLVPEPWTPVDCIASWWQIGQYFGTDGTRDLIAYRNLSRQTNTPPLRVDEAAAVVQHQDVDPAWLARAEAYMSENGFNKDAKLRLGGDEGPKFSHAWAIGGDKTSTGSAVLVSDPQTPVTNPSLFYEFHIRGKTFDARGIGVPGSPLILIGFNRNVAWGATALGADQADLFRLQTEQSRPDEYLFDGAWRQMEIRRETIAVKGTEPVDLVVRQTHLGPVITEYAFARPDEPPVALKRIPGWDTGGETIRGALAMIRARNATEFARALDDWLFPSVNAVFADRSGAVGYRTALALPLRSPEAPEGGSAAHDGSAADLDWRGIVPPQLLPQVINPSRGYVFSANHLPIGSFYPIPLGISTGGAGHNIRSWRLSELLERREHFTPEEVLAVHYDRVNPVRRDLVAIAYSLREKGDHEFSTDAAAALDYLEGWLDEGASASLTEAGGALTSLINLSFRQNNTDLTLRFGGGATGLVNFVRSARSRLEEGLDPDEIAYIDQLLAAAWRAGGDHYGEDPATWPIEAQMQLSQQQLGYFEGLHGFPSPDQSRALSFPALSVTDGNTIHSQRTQAYTQFVPLDQVDQSQSILPVGNAEDPESPFHTSTLDLWAEGRLHPAPLSRAAVEQYMTSRFILDKKGSTAVAVTDQNAPLSFALEQNSPNPFNAQTTIKYTLAAAGEVKLTIYTLSGQVGRSWTLEHGAAGTYTVAWDGRDQAGLEMASGTYLYRMENANSLQQKKMVLIR
ncbi:MAG: penicillin acylase family protein [Candidatus Latescibacterota bacterium]|nr:penicillin acylase family protein [Candidatus Latescibacterota bacterium]